MAQLVIGDLDESKIWLHAERIGDRLILVDQDGRAVGGVTDASIHLSVSDMTKIDITLESASRKEDGKISKDYRG